MNTCESRIVRFANEIQNHRVLGTLEDNAVLRDMGLVQFPAVVEPRGDLYGESHLTAYAPNQAYELMPVGCNRGAGNRHEIEDFADTCLGEETRDEDGGVGIVELLSPESVGRRHGP